MNQVVQTKKVQMAVIAAIVGMFTTVQAAELQDVFSYQSAKNSLESEFIQSNVEGLFEGQKLQKNFSDQFALEMVRLKSAHKEFGFEHRNILETNTRIDLVFAKQFISRIGLGNTRQDISIFGQEFESDGNQQSMYSFTQSWKKILNHDASVETYLGLVQTSNQESAEEKYYPIFGMKFQKDFGNQGEIQVHAAQEIQSGGSYTGMYGNQIFRKLMVVGKIPLIKKLAFLWDAGIGLSQSSFQEKGFSFGAGVATVSASVEYGFGKNVKGVFGYSHRTLMEQSGVGTEGHMMSASFSFANF